MTNHDDGVPKFFRNELFYFIARASMLFGSLIGLPVAGYMLTRIINASDAIAAQVSEQAVAIKVLTTTTGFRIDNSDKILIDHEARIRLLERKN